MYDVMLSQQLTLTKSSWAIIRVILLKTVIIQMMGTEMVPETVYLMN
jgi:hypothetical protein